MLSVPLFCLGTVSGCGRTAGGTFRSGHAADHQARVRQEQHQGEQAQTAGLSRGGGRRSRRRRRRRTTNVGTPDPHAPAHTT